MKKEKVIAEIDKLREKLCVIINMLSEHLLEAEDKIADIETRLENIDNSG